MNETDGFYGYFTDDTYAEGWMAEYAATKDAEDGAA